MNCFIFVFATLWYYTSAQLAPIEARWCVMNSREWEKCGELKSAIVERARMDHANKTTSPYDTLPTLLCITGTTPFDCMERIAGNEADLMSLDPGMGYTAGQYYTMMPLMAERYSSAPGDDAMDYWAVAVVRKGSGIDINNLAGKKSCHTGVGRAAGWVHPISTLIKDKRMEITECNVPVKSAAAYFGDMCAPNALARYYNPFGNNPATVCNNCQGTYDDFCSSNDPYAGYHGAFECMASRKGDVAFVRHYTIEIATANSSQYNPTDFELVCPQGGRAAWNAPQNCNFGKISAHVAMTSAVRDADTRGLYKKLLSQISTDFGPNGKFSYLFKVFQSSKYGSANLMFTDATQELRDVGDRDSYYSWAGAEFRERLGILNDCPISQARWCVISRHEMMKCERMIMAFAAKGLKPDLNCILGSGSIHCMDKIKEGDADMMALDAADVYIAGKHYGLVPIAAEDYSGYDNAIYYSVAVARKMDAHLTIFNLKNRRSCHSAVNTAAGWIIPVDKLIDTEQIKLRHCNVYLSVGQFFSKSCVPGILQVNYNPHTTNPVNLCEACAAGGEDRCQRTDEELYYGNSGAFRCLTELGGDVAFVKHTTVRESTDGRNRADWARNRRSDDYELMCNDGRRAPIDDWANCNMGQIPANAIVTASFKSQEIRDIYWTLLNYAQQFFASDNNDDFNMFNSDIDPDHRDLVFQDSTVRLVPVDPENQDYQAYLGNAFVRAMKRMERIDCVTTNTAAHINSITVTCLTAVILVLSLL